MQCNHSHVFQPQFRSSFCLAKHWLGVDISVILACSKRDLLDMWLLPVGMASPWLDSEMHPRSSFYLWLHISELPEKPANLPHLKTQWARFVFYWCNYLAAVFVPSLETTNVMLRADSLTNFTQQTLQDSQKAISALNAEQIQIRKVVLQNRLAWDILTAAQGGTCAIIHTQCCMYMPDMSTNINHFTKYMDKMIQAMDTPEDSTASLWTLTSSPWWKTI